MVISNRDVGKGMQRAIELALSECVVAFMNIVTSNEGKLPKDQVVRFSVDLVPKDGVGGPGGPPSTGAAA